MLGLLIHPNCYQSVVGDLWAYLTTILGVESKRWKFLHSKTTDSFSKPWLKHPAIHQEKDSFEPAYYRWNYGLDEHNIRGTGITFSIIKNDGIAEEVATLIQITKRKKVVAYEFCFGIEAMIGAIENLPSIHCASLISKVIPFKDETLRKQLQDSIATLTAMYHYGLRAGCQNNPNALAKKVMRRLKMVVSDLRVKSEDIYEWVAAFETLEFGSDSGAANHIVADLERY